MDRETSPMRALAACVVLFRRQMEAEKMRLSCLAAFAGGCGSGAYRAGRDGRWSEVAVALVLALIAGALFEWRWSVAMRVPGRRKEDPHG